jgi:glycine/serine hydroxymethyltransferase
LVDAKRKNEIRIGTPAATSKAWNHEGRREVSARISAATTSESSSDAVGGSQSSFHVVDVTATLPRQGQPGILYSRLD